MSQPGRRIIKVAHASAGRTRLRLGWLHREPAQAGEIADALAELEGVLEVRARAATGSVLCLHDPETLSAEDIAGRVADLTGAALEAPPEPDRAAAAAGAANRSVALALMQGVRGLDGDLRDATSGRLDLGTLAAAGFLTLGAAEVLATRKLPMPPWFNLAWWAFRTFTAFEHADGAPEAESAGDLEGGGGTS